MHNTRVLLVVLVVLVHRILIEKKNSMHIMQNTSIASNTLVVLKSEASSDPEFGIPIDSPRRVRIVTFANI